MQPCDAESVTLLITQLGYERPLADVCGWIERLARVDDQQAAFVACVSDEVVGWIEVSIQWHLQYVSFALIGGPVVKDGVRGLGIGRRLCEQAEQWSRQHKIDVLRVTSRSTREDAHRFYLQNSYSHVKDSAVFEKKLTK